MRRRTKYMLAGALVTVVVLIFLIGVFKDSKDNNWKGKSHFDSKVFGNERSNSNNNNKGNDKRRNGHNGEDSVEELVHRVDSLIKQTKEKREKLKSLDGELDELQAMAKQAAASREQSEKAKDQSNPVNSNTNVNHNTNNGNKNSDNSEVVAAVVVVACNRPSVSRALELLIKYRPSASKFPIVVSQDCGDKKTADVIAGFANQGVDHMEQPDLSEPEAAPQFRGYAKIARHYGWMLKQVFDVKQYEAVIIVEDDLDVAPDFFEYFEAGKKLLQTDDTLWCVSAWNDNGKKGYVEDPKKLYRSDFFGGLGWMLTRKLWVEELSSKWPSNFWDDWMREHEQRQGRACIRPEISRTSTFGRVGVSRGQFFDQYLKYIQLADSNIKFSEEDLSYLLKDNYDLEFLQEVYTAPLVSATGAVHSASPIVRVEYTSPDHFRRIAKEFGIMDDLKDNIPRTAYFGVVSFRKNNKKIHLAPVRPWKGYE
eukprot:m.96550 g.96550  ORF g.96550 m.96550 type:complete len:481 (-) comp12470_c0_seq1:50-1492(-)